MKTKNKPPIGAVFGCLIGISMIIACAIMLIHPQKEGDVTTAQGTNNPDPQRLQMTKVLQAYLVPLNGHDDWWMKKTLAPGAGTARILTDAIGKIQSTVERCRSASPFAEEIAQRFPGFYTSVYMNDRSMVVSEGDIDMSSLAGKLEVCFISEEEFRKGKLPSSLFYSEGWNAVMMGAKNWPDIFFGAVLMHELGHAFRKQARQAGHPGQQSESDWYREEVDMHEFEGLVLDAGTKGKYLKAIDAIIASHGKARTASELLGNVNSDELLKLDTMIGLEDSGPEIRGLSVAEHIVILGFRFIDKHSGGLDAKIAHYRWIEGR